MQSIILTGATGMLGTAVIAECIKNGISVTAVARPSSYRLGRIPKSGSVTVIECGLDNMHKLPALVTGKHDAFYHLGWLGTSKSERNDPAIQELNVKYTLDAVNVADELGCGLFLGAGSQAEYGRYDVPIKEDFETKPDTAYGRAKLSACKSSAELCGRLKIKHVWTRIFSVYGPNDSPSTMVMYFIGRLLDNQRASLSKCTQIWDYMYCSDAARALLLAGEKGGGGRIYNVGNGIGRPLIEYVNILRDAIDPAAVLGIGELKQVGKLMNLCADITKIKKDTSFKPMVPFERGIEETIKWYRENIK
jgi:nucleoside-diphosphate-sugar epimerase